MAGAIAGATGKLLILALGIVSAVGMVSLLAGKRPGGFESAATDRNAPPAFSETIDAVLPGVVSIEVERVFRHADLITDEEERLTDSDPEFDQREFEIPSSGSGFVIDPRGYILTNDHVVRDGQRFDVRFTDGRTVSARLVGRDPMTDIAVLKVESEPPLLPIHLGDSDDVRIGDWVVAIGNPLGMLEGSVSFGIVSGKGRSEIEIRGGSPSYQDFIQTDASINPGSSGGPLLNDRGEAIGVNAAFNEPGNGIGFAISMNVARSAAEELIENGRVPRGFLGVNLMSLDPDLAAGWGLKRTQGVVITDVQERTPASESGLEAGDIIIEFDGVTVEKIQPFRLLVAGTKVGRLVPFRYLRHGEPRGGEVRLTERDDPVPVMPEARPSKPVEDLGLFLSRSISSDGGVRIDSLRTLGVAYRAGLRSGDVILDVGWREVGSPEELRTELERQLDGRGVVALYVERLGYRTFVPLRVR